MDERGTCKPGHERGVFHRVPEPPTTPSQFVVRPPTAERDTQGQECPGAIRPGSRPTRPGTVQAAGQERRDRESEGYRETDVARVQHRRVYDQAEVLQQRVEIGTVRRCQWQQPLEGVAGEDQKAQKAQIQQPHDAQDPGVKVQRQAPPQQGDRRHPDGHDEHPEQQRALMGAPYRTHLVVPGQQAVGVVRDIRDGKVVADEGVHQHHERQCGEHKLAQGGRCRRLHPAHPTDLGAEQSAGTRHRAQHQRQHQAQVAEFRNHRRPSAPSSTSGISSGGM